MGCYIPPTPKRNTKNLRICILFLLTKFCLLNLLLPGPQMAPTFSPPRPAAFLEGAEEPFGGKACGEFASNQWTDSWPLSEETK